MSEFVPLGEARKKYLAEQEESRQQYLKENRLKEGEHEGRITKLSAEISRNGNAMYVAVIKCTGNDGKKTEVKTNFVKSSTYALNQFYELVEKAGFDLLAIDTEDKFDLVFDAFEETLPKIKFECKHQAPPSDYNNYEVTWCENIAPDSLALKQTTKETVEKVEQEKKLGSQPKTSEPDYTAADVNKFEKDECIEVAEELGINLVGKTKTAMRKEIIAFLENSSSVEEAPIEEEEEEEESEENPFLDED